MDFLWKATIYNSDVIENWKGECLGGQLSCVNFSEVVLIPAVLNHHDGLLLEECGFSRRWIDFSCIKVTKKLEKNATGYEKERKEETTLL